MKKERIFLRKSLMNTEEWPQAGERRIESFVEKDKFSLKKGLIKTGSIVFLLEGIDRYQQEELQ